MSKPRRSVGLAVASLVLALSAVAVPTASAEVPRQDPIGMTAVDEAYRDGAGVYHYAFDPAAIPQARLEKLASGFHGAAGVAAG